MLKFFALYKRKITGISNTAFYHQIGIILAALTYYALKYSTFRLKIVNNSIVRKGEIVV